MWKRLGTLFIDKSRLNSLFTGLVVNVAAPVIAVCLLIIAIPFNSVMAFDAVEASVNAGSPRKAEAAGNRLVKIEKTKTAQIPPAQPATAQVPVKGKKILSGGAMDANQYQFILAEGAGNDVSGYSGIAFSSGRAKAYAGLDGVFNFGSLIFSKEGAYTFIVTERASREDSNNEGFTFDNDPVTISIVVTKTGAQLAAAVTTSKNGVDTGGAIEFWDMFNQAYAVKYKVSGIAPATASPAPAQKSYVRGAVVPIERGLTTTETGKDGAPGTWSFDGWTAPDVAVVAGFFGMPSSNVTFTGKWTFTPVVGAMAHVAGVAADTPNAPPVTTPNAPAKNTPASNAPAPEAEKKFNLKYDVNGGAGDSGPFIERGLLPETGRALNSAEVPVHADADGNAVIFVGWAEKPESRIYTKDDPVPPTVTNVDIVDRDVTVYALWGYDTAGSGRPDVLAAQDAAADQSATGPALDAAVTGPADIAVAGGPDAGEPPGSGPDMDAPENYIVDSGVPATEDLYTIWLLAAAIIAGAFTLRYFLLRQVA